MLAKVSGIIEKKAPGKVVLSLGAIALEILVPLCVSEELPPEGEECSLFVTERLRGEVFELYGFADWESRELFGRLQSISRVGPRLALNILSVFRPEELSEIVAQADYKRLARVPGIGPRRAERLCVELRNRLGIDPQKAPASPAFSEALSTLLNLGFSRDEAQKALNEVFREDLELSELVREALRKLSAT
ncbi:MAG: Holliday junction branch migration protein RuvA [Thermodesulfobacteria bacterium]|nr:Holliday junction branch migration protein RuvA [Thermodesulfobacteriota bacterium]